MPVPIAVLLDSSREIRGLTNTEDAALEDGEVVPDDVDASVV
jgi:hypothetical protein